MQNIEQIYEIKAPINKVWEALVDPKIIADWGGGPASMSDKQGADFSLWRGDIHGTNVEVIKSKMLKQDWFSNEWKEPSHVVFELEEEDGVTKVKLIQDNIPDNDVKEISQGWKDYYLGPLKELLER